jgi:hypothetical protein
MEGRVRMSAKNVEQAGREILVDETQRDAERGALRRVRGALDEIQDQDRAMTRVGRKMVIIAGVLIALFVVLVLVLMLAGRSSEIKGPPLVISPAQAR